MIPIVIFEEYSISMMDFSNEKKKRKIKRKKEVIQ